MEHKEINASKLLLLFQLPRSTSAPSKGSGIVQDSYCTRPQSIPEKYLCSLWQNSRTGFSTQTVLPTPIMKKCIPG
jgi:hypothetical protein